MQLVQRWLVFQRAQAAAQAAGKPLLVVGNPHGQYGCGDVVLDLEASAECPVQAQATVEAIPYPDGYFGAAFISHVLEHTCDPQRALAELHRVADRVFVIYPWPWRIVAYAVPGHTWLVTGSTENPRFSRLRDKCDVPGYFGVGAPVKRGLATRRSASPSPRTSR